MKKAIVVVLLILILLLLAVPGAVGIVAENQFRTLSSNLESDVPGFKLVLEDYQRGWFSSRARYRLSFRHPAMETALREQLEEFEALPTLINEAEIFHGPVPFAALGRDGASLAPVVARSFDRVSLALSDGEVISLPAQITTRLAIFGDHRNNIKVERFEREFDDPGDRGSLSWDGMTLNTRFSTKLDRVALAGQIGAVAVSSGKFQFRAGPARLDSRQQRSDYGIWIGAGQASSQGLRLEAADERSFSMGELQSEVRSDITAGMLNQDIVVIVSEIGVAGWQGGPVRLNIAIEKLDAQAVGELAELLGPLASTGNQEVAATRILPLVFPQVQALLAGGPHLVIREMSFGTPDGAMTLTADLAFPESEPEAAFGFITGLVGVAKLRIPAALMTSLAARNSAGRAQFQGLLDAGFLVRNEDYLVLDAVVKGGLLTINGQPIPLPIGF